jgi:DinB superfamily
MRRRARPANHQLVFVEGPIMSMTTAKQIVPVLEQLSRGPALVRQVIYEMPPELRKRRPAPGVWSAHEHAVHLPAVQPIMVRRLDYMLSDPAPRIKSYEPSRDDPDDALLKLDLDAEMDRFDRERSELVERLKTLTPDQWAIRAEHEEYAQYGVLIMFRHIALHDLHHAYKIEERLLRKEWS